MSCVSMPSTQFLIKVEGVTCVFVSFKYYLGYGLEFQLTYDSTSIF